jgi:hypothetical protein
MKLILIMQAIRVLPLFIKMKIEAQIAEKNSDAAFQTLL